MEMEMATATGSPSTERKGGTSMNEPKTLQTIRTMGALIDNRRTRTPAGALLELSAMANEKTLLRKELARWKRRHAEIQKRLGEIAAKERKLMALVQAEGYAPGAPPEPIDPANPNAEAHAGFAGFTNVAARPAEIAPDAAARIKVQELTY
jgi:hypothetical protein